MSLILNLKSVSTGKLFQLLTCIITTKNHLHHTYIIYKYLFLSISNKATSEPETVTGSPLGETESINSLIITQNYKMAWKNVKNLFNYEITTQFYGGVPLDSDCMTRGSVWKVREQGLKSRKKAHKNLGLATPPRFSF